MGVTPFWTDQDSRHEGFAGFWDGIFFEGYPLPGLWSLSVVKERSLEKAKQGGIDGNALRDKGYVGAVLRAKGKIWTPAQLEELENWIPRYDPKVPGSSRAPVNMYHPASSLMGIYSVYIRKITIPELTSQILQPEIEIEEWFPKVKPADPSTKVKGFDGAKNSGAPLNASDFSVPPLAVTKPRA
jgi:hypothetical protein